MESEFNINMLFKNCDEKFEKLKNNLFIDICSEQYLSNLLLIIANKISEEEVEKIILNKIYSPITISPANSLSNLSIPTSSERVLFHLISIDKTLFDFIPWTHDEKAAMLMHEIGHILNDLPDVFSGDRILYKELYADDYAKRNGFKSSLKSSLVRYKNSELPWLAGKTELIDQRIARLNQDNPDDLFGIIKQLRGK